MPIRRDASGKFMSSGRAHSAAKQFAQNSLVYKGDTVLGQARKTFADAVNRARTYGINKVPRSQMVRGGPDPTSVTVRLKARANKYAARTAAAKGQSLPKYNGFPGGVGGAAHKASLATHAAFTAARANGQSAGVNKALGNAPRGGVKAGGTIVKKG